MKPIVLVTDHDMPSFSNPDLSIERQIFEKAGYEVRLVQCPRHPNPSSSKAVVDEIKKIQDIEIHAILSQGATLDREVLNAGLAKGLKVVGRYGTGTDVIDRDAASELGIAVRWVPGYSIDEVSDHAVALLMALHRNILQSHKDCSKGDWSLKNANNLRRTSSQVVGVMGYGLIGQAAARKFSALGFQTITYDPVVSSPNNKSSKNSEDDKEDPFRKLAQRDNVHIVSSLEELQQRSDYISLHMPSIASTKHIINNDFIDNCKKDKDGNHGGVSIINTGRGALIDENALLNGLRSNKIDKVALDVREIEPPRQPDLLIEEFPDRVVVTPHSAFTSIESRIELKTRLAEEVTAVLLGESRALGHLLGRA